MKREIPVSEALLRESFRIPDQLRGWNPIELVRIYGDRSWRVGGLCCVFLRQAGTIYM